MAFKVTYTDGQADNYGGATKWAVEGGVLKMGRELGNWTVLVSPSHWATIEVVSDKERGNGDAEDRDRGDGDRGDDGGDDGGDERRRDGGDERGRHERGGGGGDSAQHS